MRAYWVVVLAGCWSTPRPVEPEPVAAPVEQPVTLRTRPKVPSHCERAIDHVIVLMQPDIDRNQTLRDRQASLREAAVQGCVETGWADEALHCYDDAGDMSGLQPCFGKLTDDQRTDFNQRMTEAMRQPVP